MVKAFVGPHSFFSKREGAGLTKELQPGAVMLGSSEIPGAAALQHVT